MPYDEKLADRIRESIAHIPKVEEKKMFRGLTFMVNGKMCVCVSGDEMMCRFDPSLQNTVAEKNEFRPMRSRARGRDESASLSLCFSLLNPAFSFSLSFSNTYFLLCILALF